MPLLLFFFGGGHLSSSKPPPLQGLKHPAWKTIPRENRKSLPGRGNRHPLFMEGLMTFDKNCRQEQLTIFFEWRSWYEAIVMPNCQII